MNAETIVIALMTRVAAMTMPMMPDGDDARDGGEGDDCDGGDDIMAMVMVMVTKKKTMMVF